MARAGVNYIHIAKAAEAIKESGLEPTVDRVREQLGTGSKSTIAPLLKQWKAQNEASGDVSGLPSDLVEVVKSLYERVQQEAESKIEAVSSGLNETISGLKEELAGVEQQNLQLTGQNNELALSNKVAIEELETLRTQAIKYQLEAANNASAITDLKASVKEAKEENRAARESLEHYQTRVAEERHALNQQQQQLTQQLQEQVSQLSAQLSEVNAKLHSQQQLLNEKEKEFHAVLSKKQQLENELTNKSETIDDLRDKVASAIKNYEQSSLNYEKLQKDHGKVIIDKLSALKEVELLNKSLSDKRSELIALQDKLSVLDENHKLAQQEKAVIEGRLKQLEKSF
jgi:chromosome segregation ATPase